MKDLPESEDFFFMTGSAGMNKKRDPSTSGEEDEQEQVNCGRTKDPDYHRFFSYFGTKIQVICHMVKQKCVSHKFNYLQKSIKQLNYINRMDMKCGCCIFDVQNRLPAFS